jgi:CheY-like chemotaxis protein
MKKMAKILLVEDDNNLREIYEARLQAEGYTIVSARDGEEALVVAKAEKPDLIISDIMMPKISGFEMLDILRNTEGLKHVKVIMLTALGQSDDQQRADKLGADRYLVKSQVTLEDIVKATHDLLADGPTPAVVAEAASKPPAAPTGPTPAPAIKMPVAEPPAKPPTPTPASDAADNAASDDKLMNDAVNSLIADTEKKPAASKDSKSAAKSIKISAASSATDTDSKPAEDEETPKDNTEVDDEQHNVPIAHKKVIKPIDNKDKKDLATLLAEEEAKEAGTTLPSKDDTDDDDTDDAKPADTDKAEEELIDAAKSDKAAASTAAEEASVDAKIEDFVAGATTEPTPPSNHKPTTATPPPAKTAEPPATPSTPPKDPSDPNIIAI